MTHNEVILSLNIIKEAICASQDRNEISSHIETAIKIGLSNTAHPYDGLTNGAELAEKSKKMIIGILENERSLVLNENHYDLDSVHFQVGASLVMLMLKYTSGLDTLNRIVEKAGNSK